MTDRKTTTRFDRQHPSLHDPHLVPWRFDDQRRAVLGRRPRHGGRLSCTASQRLGYRLEMSIVQCTPIITRKMPSALFFNTSQNILRHTHRHTHIYKQHVMLNYIYAYRVCGSQVHYCKDSATFSNITTFWHTENSIFGAMKMYYIPINLIK